MMIQPAEVCGRGSRQRQQAQASAKIGVFQLCLRDSQQGGSWAGVPPSIREIRRHRNSGGPVAAPGQSHLQVSQVQFLARELESHMAPS